MVDCLSLGRRLRLQKKGEVSNVRGNNMGDTGLKSHAKSEKHVQNSKSMDNSLTLENYFSGGVAKQKEKPASSTLEAGKFTVPPPPAIQKTTVPVNVNNNMHSFANKNTVLKSEILWRL